MSNLLKPIEGVSIELYAKMQAARGTGMSQDAFAKLLAENGLDLAKFGKAEKGWNDRMASDATAEVATAYGNAFMAGGAGQFGAAGKAAAGFATTGSGTTGVVAQGEEPIPFERYCEIQGAQTAWANTGQDVNAMLKETFDMNAMDFANLSGFFMSRMATDQDMMMKYSELTAKYEKEYTGEAGEDKDDDVEF
jgi:hypothetical protein